MRWRCSRNARSIAERCYWLRCRGRSDKAKAHVGQSGRTRCLLSGRYSGPRIDMGRAANSSAGNSIGSIVCGGLCRLAIVITAASFRRGKAPWNHAGSGRAAKKALELDDSLAEAHHALAAVKLSIGGNWRGGEGVREGARIESGASRSAHLTRIFLEKRQSRWTSPAGRTTNARAGSFARPWAYGYALIRSRRYDDALKRI